MQNTSTIPGLRTCLLNICTPKYAERFQRELLTQEVYARRQGYVYKPVLIQEEDSGTAKWAKLELVRTALEEFEVVLLLDADCRVAADAPDIRQVLKADKSIYMARGHSGRYNTGVILLTNSPVTTRWLETILSLRGRPIKPENKVSEEGENGHVIEVSQYPEFAGHIEELGYEWNNNRYVNRKDFIRHYSGGPMRQLWKEEQKYRGNPILRLAYQIRRGLRQLKRAILALWPQKS